VRKKGGRSLSIPSNPQPALLPYGGTPQFTISRAKRLTRFSMNTNHYHDYYEVYYLYSGERNYFIRDQIYRINKGDLVFINEYDLHKTTSTGAPPEHERMVVYFRKDLFSEYSALLHSKSSPFLYGSPVLSLQAHEQAFVEQILENLASELASRRVYFDTRIKALMLELIIFVLRLRETTKNRPMVPDKVLHSKVSDIARFINEHCGERITLADLSARFYISPFYLSRIFKSTTGFSFVEYITTIRIREAQRLLRETDRKISLIAETVGFDDFAHFGRIFKKIIEMTPMQYRKSSQRRER
jgi:YesN/AraC family two-component response regulator